MTWPAALDHRPLALLRRTITNDAREETGPLRVQGHCMLGTPCGVSHRATITSNPTVLHKKYPEELHPLSKCHTHECIRDVKSVPFPGQQPLHAHYWDLHVIVHETQAKHTT